MHLFPFYYRTSHLSMCISSYRCTSYLILVIFTLLKRSDPTKSVISLLRHLILEHLIPPKTSYKLIPPLHVSSSSHRWTSHFIRNLVSTSVEVLAPSILARPAFRLAPARLSTVVLVPFRLSRGPCTGSSYISAVWSLRRPVFIRQLRLR